GDRRWPAGGEADGGVGSGRIVLRTADGEPPARPVRELCDRPERSKGGLHLAGHHGGKLTILLVRGKALALLSGGKGGFLGKERLPKREVEVHRSWRAPGGQGERLARQRPSMGDQLWSVFG